VNDPTRGFGDRGVTKLESDEGSPPMRNFFDVGLDDARSDMKKRLLGPTDLLWIVELALVTNSEGSDFAARWYEAIECEVAAAAEQDHELSQITLDDPADQWMMLEHLDRAADRIDSSERRVGRERIERRERAFEVRQRVARIDYPRHGLGRAARLPRARRASHA
jgi:hypothetical protein